MSQGKIMHNLMIIRNPLDHPELPIVNLKEEDYKRKKKHRIFLVISLDLVQILQAA